LRKNKTDEQKQEENKRQVVRQRKYRENNEGKLIATKEKNSSQGTKQHKQWLEASERYRGNMSRQKKLAVNKRQRKQYAAKKNITFNNENVENETEEGNTAGNKAEEVAKEKGLSPQPLSVRKTQTSKCYREKRKLKKALISMNCNASISKADILASSLIYKLGSRKNPLENINHMLKSPIGKAHMD